MFSQIGSDDYLVRRLYDCTLQAISYSFLHIIAFVILDLIFIHTVALFISSRVFSFNVVFFFLSFFFLTFFH